MKNDLYVVVMQNHTHNTSEICYSNGRTPFIGNAFEAVNTLAELQAFCSGTDVEYRIAKLSFLD